MIYIVLFLAILSSIVFGGVIVEALYNKKYTETFLTCFILAIFVSAIWTWFYYLSH